MMNHAEYISTRGAEEHFFASEGKPGKNFAAELEQLLREYECALLPENCSEESEFFLRFHLSDITNQAPALREALAGRKSFISMIGQPPANGARAALEAWHVQPFEKTIVADTAVKAELNNYTALLFRTDESFSSSGEQTSNEFHALEGTLNYFGGSVAENTLRTWLYCRDVDNNYAGLVQARNKFFASKGLTAETHFITSTGIEGLLDVPNRLVKMDSLNWFGLGAGQIRHLSAPEMLSPTAVYGVSFERGTRITFGDRSHFYISGTASIDGEGKVVHPFDVEKQTERMTDNVGALLADGGASLADLKQATVYLRDTADAPIVRKTLERVLPGGVPAVLLKAPVCRPAWLVEMECIAVNADGDSSFPDFN